MISNPADLIPPLLPEVNGFRALLELGEDATFKNKEWTWGENVFILFCWPHVRNSGVLDPGALRHLLKVRVGEGKRLLSSTSIRSAVTRPSAHSFFRECLVKLALRNSWFENGCTTHFTTVKSIVYGSNSFHGHYFCLKLHKSLQGIIDIIGTFFLLKIIMSILRYFTIHEPKSWLSAVTVHHERLASYQLSIWQTLSVSASLEENLTVYFIDNHVTVENISHYPKIFIFACQKFD